MRKVAVIRSVFLPISETFIYNELTNLKKTKAILCTQRRINKKEFPFKRVYKYKKREQLERILRKRKIKLIHARFGTIGVAVLPVKKKLGIPMLTSFHGSDLPTNRKRSDTYRKELKQLFKSGEGFTVPSKDMKRILIRFGCPKKKIHIQYSGINVNEFGFKKRALNKREKIIILSVGRLVEKKGMKYLLSAFSRVHKQFPKVELRIVGDGPLKKELKRRARKKGIRDKVHFLGRLSHEKVQKEMQKAHIFVLASIKAKGGNQEGIPNVIKEAMACGLPVVSTWHGGIPELVEHKKTGYLVKEKDKKALAESILKLIHHPERWGEMGRRGRDKVLKQFNMKHQVRKLERLYRKLVKKA
ncbi:glycosyltransferase [Ammoniphilus sp. CFH 90114]|uniref:glycosyltransferase n=1 Tax=Ammoniphilus sp. CFH 90114 TaxID=2493665 RepID=UPI0013E97489|nr:glycosyltransferase [Ammoniphilus sp. CFH 90114]